MSENTYVKGTRSRRLRLSPLSWGKRERYLWPSSVALHAPDVTSHILRVSSLDPDTMVSPLGENSHAQTEPLPFFEVSGNTFVMVVYASPPLSGGKRERYLWPSSVALHAPDVTSHILRVLSHDPDTMV
jgi:hypothetical protein